jgi:hypothetical protein
VDYELVDFLMRKSGMPIKKKKKKGKVSIPNVKKKKFFYLETRLDVLNKFDESWNNYMHIYIYTYIYKLVLGTSVNLHVAV